MTTVWDRYWEDQDGVSFWHRPADSVLALIDRHGAPQGATALDMGCGPGRHALALSRAGYSVTAVDGSPAAVRLLREAAARSGLEIHAVAGDFRTRLFAGGSFDLVVAYNVLYHGCRDDLARGIRLCHDYLTGRGVLFFTCPTRDDGKYGSGEEIAAHTYRSLNSVHPGDMHYFPDRDDLFGLTRGLGTVSLDRREYWWCNKGQSQFSSYWEVMVTKRSSG